MTKMDDSAFLNPGRDVEMLLVGGQVRFLAHIHQLMYQCIPSNRRHIIGNVHKARFCGSSLDENGSACVFKSIRFLNEGCTVSWPIILNLAISQTHLASTFVFWRHGCGLCLVHIGRAVSAQRSTLVEMYVCLLRLFRSQMQMLLPHSNAFVLCANRFLLSCLGTSRHHGWKIVSTQLSTQFSSWMP